MVEEICKEYLETGIGIESLALKYHVGKLKIKKILSDNGIEFKKRGNQRLRESYVVSDWKIEKYPSIEGEEYIVYDDRTGFKTKDIRNKGGVVSSYLKKVYGLDFPTLYDRRMYYMKTGNYWWEQWLSVKSVPIGSESVKQEEWGNVDGVNDEIGEIVTNRIREAKKKTPKVKRVAKVNKIENGRRKTKNEIFAEKGHLAHSGENLDYSLVEYKDKSTQVYIIDHDLRPDGTEYGGYWQRPENHLRGSGHPDKFRDRHRASSKEKWDELVEKFKEVHKGENIEYPPQENYVNLLSKIRFIDHDLRPDGTEYGEVWQVAADHLKGRRHPRKYFDSRIGTIAKNRKSNLQFIEDCKKVWGDRYLYDHCNYTGRTKNVTIICKEHGPFNVMAENFLQGHGCPKCGKVYRYTTDEFKEAVRKIHGDKYVLDDVEYVNAKTKVTLTCPKHGKFEITPNKLLSGQGCYECGREKIYNSLRLTIDEIIERANKVHGNKYTYENFTEYSNNVSMIVATCPKHGEFRQTVASHLAGCGCPACSSSRSKAETEIFDYVKSLGFNVEQGNRKILDGLEIDAYVPDKKIGIEFNGLYWHSEANGKGKEYHLEKTEKAEKAGVKLLQVFEDEWLGGKEIVLSKIRHILGVDNKRIMVGARKCNICVINKDEAENFLNKWHIQGFVEGTIHYGAKYNNELVAVMSFKNYSKKGEWELIRFATNGKYSVPGIGGKLFKAFVNINEPKVVKSFADRRWTLNKDNNLYTKLGFTLESITKPDYRYVIGEERKHKFGFRKQKLNKKYGVPLEWTEKEMCDALGFYRIWDCGLFKYVWKKK